MTIPEQHIPEQHLFVLAEQTLSGVFEQITDAQWEWPVTAEGAMGGGTVRDLVIAHARDDQWVGHILAGALHAGVAGADRWRRARSRVVHGA